MEKRERNNQSSYYEFDENGTNEVSEQIMNSYNSGVIDQITANASMEENDRVEG